MGTLLLAFRIFEALLLYAFFIGVLGLLYSALKDKLTLPDPSITEIGLTRLDENGEETRKQSFRKPVITIGRNMDLDVFLDNSTVSSEHARITLIKGQWWIEDENSTNGTFLNGQLIDQPSVLIDSDEISVGDQKILFSLEEQESKRKN